MANFNIRLDSIDLVNYKKFTKTSVTFDRSLTVLSGKNGSGKSSVLSGVTLILSWIIARLRNEAGVGLYVPPLDVNNRAINGWVVGRIFEGEVLVPNKAKPGLYKEHALNISPIKEYVASKRTSYSQDSTPALPVFAYYGVKRAVLDTFKFCK